MEEWKSLQSVGNITDLLWFPSERNTTLCFIQYCWTSRDPLLTWESPVCSLDSPEDLSAAPLLNPAERCHSGPDLSDGCWTSELRPEQNSWSLTTCSPSVWIKKTWWGYKSVYNPIRCYSTFKWIWTETSVYFRKWTLSCKTKMTSDDLYSDVIVY